MVAIQADGRSDSSTGSNRARASKAKSIFSFASANLRCVNCREIKRYVCISQVMQAKDCI